MIKDRNSPPIFPPISTDLKVFNFLNVCKEELKTND